MARTAPAFTAAFVKSCASLADLPADSVAEVALLGRSNVGKSSLLNSLCGVRLARTSRTPGRTRLLNLFVINQGALRLVDCPGYGYARVSRSAREDWAQVMEDYLWDRPNLKRALLLVDSRLEPLPPDLNLRDWLAGRGIPTVVVATKWDALSGNQRPVALRRLQTAFGQAPLPYSAVSHEGRNQLQELLLQSGE